jgi:hypothetical protein
MIGKSCAVAAARVVWAIPDVVVAKTSTRPAISRRIDISKARLQFERQQSLGRSSVMSDHAILRNSRVERYLPP